MAWRNPARPGCPAGLAWRCGALAEDQATPRPNREETVTVRDELQARALFEQRYGVAASPVAVEIERRVIGGDWGANGYTTMVQADQLAGGLGLSAAERLLDIGTGRGWPGLYLAARSGCRVVLADLPLEGLRVAAARARADSLAARTSVVAAAASALPFHAHSFDAIIHTDVLC